MHVSYGAKSDIGLKRSCNEDWFCADADLGLFVVCDGMGGRNAGEVASSLAAQTIRGHILEASTDPDLPVIGEGDRTCLAQTDRLASAVRLANDVLYREARRRPGCAGMGTTVAATLIHDQILSLAHVGDSRVYLIRHGDLQPLTVDHSLVAEQVRHGLLTDREAECSPHKHIVTRALGVDVGVEVDVSEMPLLSGDVLLLCSDGLTSRVTHDDIVAVVRRDEELQAMADGLIETANRAGGHDNITVVLARVTRERRKAVWRTLWNRLIFREP
jgi:serine/threonine protein phosphatase PrpC